MEDQYLFIALFSGIWCLIGVIFAVIGVVMGNHRKRKLERCTMYTSAKVVDVVRRTSTDSDGYSSSSWHPVFEYYAGSEQIVQESSYGSSPPKFQVGQTVELYYDPDNVYDYYVVQDNTAKILSVVFTAVGGVCIAIGVIAAVVVVLT